LNVCIEKRGKGRRIRKGIVTHAGKGAAASMRSKGGVEGKVGEERNVAGITGAGQGKRGEPNKRGER